MANRLENYSPIFMPHSHRNVIVLSVRQRLFDVFKQIPSARQTYDHAVDFLLEQGVNKNNYEAYRSELNFYLSWCWEQGIDVTDVSRKHILTFIEFGNTPPDELVTHKPAKMLIPDGEEYEINPEWRPFKKASMGQPYSRKRSTIVRQLSVLSSFYIYLSDYNYCQSNPPSLALRRLNLGAMDNINAEDKDNKSLSQLQLSYMFRVLDELCLLNPARFERSRFLMYLMIMAFPRRSEVGATLSYSPTMADFERHSINGKTKFSFNIRKSKGGKSRKVGCPRLLIFALMRYRRHLGLPDLPTRAETDVPLFVRHKAAAHGRDTGVLDANLSDKVIADLIKEVYELTAIQLENDEHFDEAESIRQLSAHSTRHTGITLALSAGRAPDKLMFDTGHSSLAALMIYNSRSLEYRIEDVEKLDERIIELAQG
ncbi:hypothetical protein AKH08_16125 [Vibrio parahaemolyticus]|nr:hypothetical protein AKH08_16125 [Vibrio parahaemolyticus]